MILTTLIAFMTTVPMMILAIPPPPRPIHMQTIPQKMNTIKSFVRANPGKTVLGVAVGTSILGAGIGSGLGALRGLASSSANKEHLTDEQRTKVVQAGTIQGAIDGALILPFLISDPITSIPGQVAAAKHLGVNDLDRVAKAASASGSVGMAGGMFMPSINPLLGSAKGATHASVLGVDPKMPAAMGLIQGGELDSIVKFRINGQ